MWGKYESFYLKDKNELQKKQQKLQARAHSKKTLGDIRDEREKRGCYNRATLVVVDLPKHFRIQRAPKR